MRNKFISSHGLALKSNPGDGFAADPVVTSSNSDTAHTMTVAELSGGVYQRFGTNTSRTDTTDTAANLIAAWDDWDIGSIKPVLYANASTANPTTIGAGAGVTLVGNAAVAAGTSRWLLFRKDSATAVTCFIC